MMHEDIGRYLYYLSSVGCLGYFLWLLKELNRRVQVLDDKIDTIQNSHTALKTEHDTYKELNLCPLMKEDNHHGR